MSTAFAGIFSKPPSVLVQPVKKDPEQSKYEKAWNHPAYRDFAPGEHAAQLFLSLAHPERNDTVIDFGAGTGRGALMLALLAGCKVHMLDFAGNCLDEDVRNALSTQAHVLSFTKHDLRKPAPVVAKYGYCTDVMEHIEPEEVDRVLHHILKGAQHVFFQISTVPDYFGKELGEDLHLTVQPYEWWEAKLKEHDAVINWSAKSENTCAFYVTAWQSAQELVRHGTINQEQEVVDQQIRLAIARNLTDARPHQKTDTPVMILAGGPSMAQYEDEIRERRARGEKLITVNGAYNWCMERGITPSAQIMVDSREFNKRFLEPVHPEVRYLMASQCHPAAFDTIPADQIVMWHSASSPEAVKVIEPFYSGTARPFFPVIGGSTVMLRALPLMVLLGYSKFELFGFDSCLVGGTHHSYAQPENDGQAVFQVVCNGRSFDCHPWMVSQAQEFLDLMSLMSEHIELNVRGDGLIAWMIQTASEMGDVSLEEIPT